MTLTYDTFAGVNILVPTRGVPNPGTPQEVQIERVPGCEGTISIMHGRGGRRIQLVGFAVAQSGALLLAREAAIKQMIGATGTLVHWLAGCATAYAYCRMENYYLTGDTGVTPTGWVDSGVAAEFWQDYWSY